MEEEIERETQVQKIERETKGETNGLDQTYRERELDVYFFWVLRYEWNAINK